jgi:exodeoxyribonuclease-3
MRIISWNVNGIRATTNKLKDGRKAGSPTDNVIKTLIKEQNPDILCFQEVKTQNDGDLSHFKSDYKYIFTNFSKYKKGYSGVALMTNTKPIWISHDFKMYSEDQLGSYNNYEFVNEGRMITARFKDCVVVTTYVPNAQAELARLEDRIDWESFIRTYLKKLKEENNVPVIFCGDLNVAPDVIDIHDPKGKNKTPGFSKEEREEFKKLVDCGFVDSFRHVYPDRVKYSYFSNFANAREKNKGWRIDMMLVSDKDKIIDADCLTDYYGSDHVPILLDINV